MASVEYDKQVVEKIGICSALKSYAKYSSDRTKKNKIIPETLMTAATITSQMNPFENYVKNVKHKEKGKKANHVKGRVVPSAGIMWKRGDKVKARE